MDMDSPPVAAYWHIQHISGRHPFPELNFQNDPFSGIKSPTLEGFAKSSCIKNKGKVNKITSTLPNRSFPNEQNLDKTGKGTGLREWVRQTFEAGLAINPGCGLLTPVMGWFWPSKLDKQKAV